MTKYLIEQGYDPAFGARPLKRLIQRELETALAKDILKGELPDGSQVVVDYEDDRVVTSVPH